MGLVLVTPATALPVSLATVRAFCAVEDGSRDSLLGTLLAGVCAHAGRFLDRSLGEAGYRLVLDTFSDAIELPVGPVFGSPAVRYLDTAGVQQTVDSALYTLDLSSNPQWVVLNDGEDWPETLEAVNAVSVEFTAGWTEATLPPDVKAAVGLCVAAQFDANGDPDRIRKSWEMLERGLFPHRRIRI